MNSAFNNPTSEINRLFAQRVSDPAGTLAALEDQLRLHGNRLQPEDLLKIQAGRAFGLAALNRFPEAVARADEAEPLLQQIADPDPEACFEIRRIRGRQALHDKRDVDALRLTLLNIDRAEALGNERLLAIAHSDVAAVYGTAGNMLKTLSHLQQSLQRTPESNTLQYGALLNNLGMVYLNVNREEEAIACFVRAREAFTEAGNDLQIAVTLANEGQALEASGALERASALHRRALALFDAGGYGHYQAASNYKLGRLMARKGKYDEAEQMFRRALEITARPDSGLYEDEAREAYGRFLIDQGRPAEAVAQFERIVQIIRSGGMTTSLTSALRRLAEAQEASGDGAAAMTTLKEIVELHDTRDDEPARSSAQTEIMELELSLERQVELVSATSSALVEANRRLSEQARELETLAATDHLTSLWNRRYFMRQLESALQGSRRSDNEVFSLMFLDIDDFKLVNDRYGHEAGDLVLQNLSEIMREAVRSSDVVARWGGEEFALLLRGADGEAAEAVARKLQEAVAGFSWSGVSAGLSITVSAGLIISSDHPGASADEIMNMVDTLLYRAKLAGRNRIERAAPGVAAGSA